ncbi:MAG: gamma-glutamylcyclotransferase [Saprospiraceae bacterium]|nr:gamma-glutamylcyclotransferase [Saprospiraceae bacterium]
MENTNNYLFSYSSLLCKKSREQNGSYDEVNPVNVCGVKRGWYHHILDDQNCALGLIRSENDCCNGILLATTESDLVKTDHRETIHVYERIQIPRTRIDLYKMPEHNEEMKIWSYVINAPSLPSQHLPIAQSYLDVVMTGYLEHGEGFCISFLKNTHGWNGFLVNDRAQPKYRRCLEGLDLEHMNFFLLKMYKR